MIDCPSLDRPKVSPAGEERARSPADRIWSGGRFCSAPARFVWWILAPRLEGMERRRWLQAAVLMCLLLLCSGRELKNKRQAPAYNSTLAKTLAEYTSAVYTNDLSQLFTWTCEKCGDLTEGFEVIDLIIDVKNCLEAYVGFASDMSAVVVAFRGTQENSIQNWIEDLFWKQLDFDYPGMTEAKVSMANIYDENAGSCTVLMLVIYLFIGAQWVLFCIS
uniref:Uncharacterized protein n=2 Tax=Aegilops tauschii subsp. strangulata TaxID=200361 RepID=A0A452YZ09_AEGTS